MGQYGDAAVLATHLLQQGACTSPLEAWRSAVREIIPSQSSQEKVCPKTTFLALCELGLVVGVKPGSYSAGTTNKEHAREAVRLLTKEPALAEALPSQLWDRVTGGDTKYNEQTDVVLALWNARLLLPVTEPPSA